MNKPFLCLGYSVFNIKNSMIAHVLWDRPESVAGMARAYRAYFNSIGIRLPLVIRFHHS